MSQSRGLSLIHRLCIMMLLVAGLVIVNLGAGGNKAKASACPTCFSESATAYTYCRDHGGTYVGCNFTHECAPGDTANSIYRLECQLSH